MSIRFVSGKHTETIEKRQLEKRRRRVVVAEPRAILRPQQPEERARLTPKALVLRSHAEVGRLDNVKNPHPSISKECTLHDTFRQHKISLYQIIKLSWFQVKDRKKACSKIKWTITEAEIPMTVKSLSLEVAEAKHQTDDKHVTFTGGERVVVVVVVVVDVTCLHRIQSRENRGQATLEQCQGAEISVILLFSQHETSGNIARFSQESGQSKELPA